MARPTRVRMVVFDEVMYRGNGIVKKWMVKIVRRFSAEAKIACPKRSGDLAASIRGTTATTGPRSVKGNIGVGGARAPYADFVLRGTTGPIYSDQASEEYPLSVQAGGPGEKFGGNPAHAGRMWTFAKRSTVNGQPANNFMFVAWDRTADDHTAIRRTSSVHLTLSPPT